MSKRQFDSNGWYEVKDNPISKAGVFQYLGKNISPELESDKIYNVWRPESELNNPETINSFKLVPWIPYHEMLGKDFTPAENVGVQGTTGEQIYFKEGTLLGNIKVYGEKLASMIQDGIKELSLGFRCTWEVASGTTPTGERYDAIQKDIRGNHLASVPNGRMGSSVAVMDHSVFALDQNDVVKIEPNPNGEDMKKEEVEAILKTALSPFTTAMDEISKKVDDMEKKAADKEAEEKKKAEDEEEAAKKKKEEGEGKNEGAMDASDIAAIVNEALKPLNEKITKIESSAVDANSVMKALAEKNLLADKASAIVGAFDHSDMDKQGVAKYALEKIGMACDSGLEVATLNGYLAARKQPNFTVDNAQDGVDTDKTYLNELGL